MGLINKILGKTAGEVAGEAVEQTAKNAGKEAVKQAAKKASSGIGKNAFIGGAVGSITGAGVGGLTGLATGADEDNMKSMVVMGALAGGATGAMVGAGSKMFRNKKASGSMFAQTTEDALKAAEQMATEGGKNAAVNGGAKGFFNKVGAKIDSIGERVSGKITNPVSTAAEAKWTQEALDQGYGLADLLDDGTIAGNAFKSSREKAINEAVEGVSRKAGMLGGAAQGAIMGATGGAVIGGVSGAIDEDESFIGGALKGGFIGGTLGGVAGGASGFINKDARLLKNTTSNVGALLGKK